MAITSEKVTMRADEAQYRLLFEASVLLRERQLAESEAVWSRELNRIHGARRGAMANRREFLSRARSRRDVRTLHTRNTVRYAAAGRPMHVAGMVQDLTELRRDTSACSTT